MDLGAFSISLAVGDIRKSLAFYQAFGFEPIGGKIEENWLILKNGDAKIGLFQGMFETDTLTFNPRDARGVQAELESQGVTIDTPIAAESGPCHFFLKDPDGRPVLVDQHNA